MFYDLQFAQEDFENYFCHGSFCRSGRVACCRRFRPRRPPPLLSPEENHGSRDILVNNYSDLQAALDDALSRISVLERRGGVRRSSSPTGRAAPSAVPRVSHSSGEILVSGFADLQVALDNISARLSDVESRVPGVSSPSLSGSVARYAVADVSHNATEIIVTDYRHLQAALDDILARIAHLERVFAPVNGLCNNLVRNGCSKGTANDSAVSDTSSRYRWRCDGLYGGRASGTCSSLICDRNPACTFNLSTSRSNCGATRQTACSGGCETSWVGGTACNSSQTCNNQGRCVTSRGSGGVYSGAGGCAECGRELYSCLCGNSVGHRETASRYSWNCQSTSGDIQRKRSSCYRTRWNERRDCKSGFVVVDGICKCPSGYIQSGGRCTRGGSRSPCVTRTHSCASGFRHRHAPDTSTHHRWYCGSHLCYKRFTTPPPPSTGGGSRSRTSPPPSTTPTCSPSAKCDRSRGKTKVTYANCKTSYCCPC